MKIRSVDIRNFRSIKEAKIAFENSCLVLVGINESGKSNVLKALSLLDPTKPREKKDVREAIEGEQAVTDSSVHFRLSLSQGELERVYREALKKVSFKTEKPIASLGKKTFSFREFFDYKNDILVTVNLIKNTHETFYYDVNSTLQVINDFRTPRPGNVFKIVSNTGESIGFSECIIYHHDGNQPLLTTDLTAPLSPEALNSFVGQAIHAFAKANLPKVIQWKYEDRFLLAPKVQISQFVSNPDTSEPLKNIFSLHGIEAPGKEIQEAQNKGSNGLKNLLKRTAEAATEHLHNIWKEYKDVRIELTHSGDSIQCSVTDHFNSFEFGERSDGFKRFVAFLLIISSKVKMGALTNTLILLDEPEISLHPSGARYLRDELIKISKSNTVVYSTHSIFMIDKRQIDRHLLVSKQKEQTQLQVANPEDSAFSEEEVVYGALQYSLFDNLKEKNLLFEGWKDKRAFELTHKDARLNKTAQKKLTQWGLCHIAGVKSCKNVVPIFQAANRDCTIISDDDPVAIQFKNDHEKHRLHGAWITYSSRLATAKVETMEDFYEQVYFEKHYKALSKSMHSNVSYADLTNVAFGRLAHIEGHLQKEGIAKEETKIFSNSLKQALIDDATSKSFSNVYFEFLEALASL